MEGKPNNNKRRDIYDRYRQLLKRPRLTREEIDAMRVHVQRLARAICEHVWDKRVF